MEIFRNLTDVDRNFLSGRGGVQADVAHIQVRGFALEVVDEILHQCGHLVLGKVPVLGRECVTSEILDADFTRRPNADLGRFRAMSMPFDARPLPSIITATYCGRLPLTSADKFGVGVLIFSSADYAALNNVTIFSARATGAEKDTGTVLSLPMLISIQSGDMKS